MLYEVGVGWLIELLPPVFWPVISFVGNNRPRCSFKKTWVEPLLQFSLAFFSPLVSSFLRFFFPFVFNLFLLHSCNSFFVALCPVTLLCGGHPLFLKTLFCILYNVDLFVCGGVVS